MKKIKLILPVLIVFSVILASCDSDLKNRITVRNLSQSDLTISFRGNHYEVPSGSFVSGEWTPAVYNIKDVPKGIYQYTTVYGIPAGANTASAEGDLAGEIEFEQGTRALIIYSSVMEDSAYTIFATLTTSTDLSVEENPTSP